VAAVHHIHYKIGHASPPVWSAKHTGYSCPTALRITVCRCVREIMSHPSLYMLGIPARSCPDAPAQIRSGFPSASKASPCRSRAASGRRSAAGGIRTRGPRRPLPRPRPRLRPGNPAPRSVRTWARSRSFCRSWTSCPSPSTCPKGRGRRLLRRRTEPGPRARLHRGPPTGAGTARRRHQEFEGEKKRESHDMTSVGYSGILQSCR